MKPVLEKIAKRYGTPVYVYDPTVLDANAEFFKSHLPKNALVAAAIKANSNLYLLRRLARHGIGADVVSGGELFCALKAGMKPQSIIFSGVGKTREELTYAIRSDLLAINVESQGEAQDIAMLAQKFRKKTSISLRLNPDINIKSHPKISTGGMKHKFGMSTVQAEKLLNEIGTNNHIHVAGIHAHIGSQIHDISDFNNLMRFFSREIPLIQKYCSHSLRFINFGGGFGVDDTGKKPIWLRQWLKEISRFANDHDLQCVIEPGRSMFANTGVLLTKALYRKKSDNVEFLIVDAGMNDFMRTALYDARHPMSALSPSSSRKKFVVAGPVCESTDIFGESVALPSNIKSGDLILLHQAGAYGFSMASQYNRRGRPAEVAVEGSKIKLIRRRESYKDLIVTERVRSA